MLLVPAEQSINSGSGHSSRQADHLVNDLPRDVPRNGPRRV
jgi:hypothetical protein